MLISSDWHFFRSPRSSAAVVGRGAEHIQSARAARVGWGRGGFWTANEPRVRNELVGSHFLLEEPMSISSDWHLFRFRSSNIF